MAKKFDTGKAQIIMLMVVFFLGFSLMSPMLKIKNPINLRKIRTKVIQARKLSKKLSKKKIKKKFSTLEKITLKGKGTYKVIKVSDGDTLSVQKIENNKFIEDVVKIRMYGIDAPEKMQDYGNESKQALEKMIGNRLIEIEIKNQDRYGRSVSIIYADGKNINLEMVRTGNAWWYREYNKNDTEMQQLEENAKKNKLGLFSKEGYKEPWLYRKEKRKLIKTK